MILTVVSAGLRDPSSTRLLADRIAVAAERELSLGGDEVQVRHVEVRRHAHQVADALLTGFPTGELATALADVAEADALVLVTPTFQALPLPKLSLDDAAPLQAALKRTFRRRSPKY